MQLKVIKVDGSIEQYLHTKVFGTFSSALALIDESNTFVAEQFAEAVTFYFYQERTPSAITTEEIRLKIQAVLTATGYEDAARALSDYHLDRKLKRRRIEVIDDDENESARPVCQWNKSRIVQGLVNKNGFDANIARAVASSVEEKVLKIGIMKIRRNLIKQLVSSDADIMTEAEKRLQTTAE